MSMGRIVSSAVAVLAVAGCVTVAVEMGRADREPSARQQVTTPAASPTPRPAVLPVADVSSVTSAPSSSAAAPPTTKPVTTRPAATSRPPVTTHAVPPRTVARTVAPPAGRAVVVPKPAPKPTPMPVVAVSGQRLPLPYFTGTATRVITVTARSHGSTTATLQAWTKVSGGWRRYGSAVTAHVGAAGLSAHPSEFRSATPIGSFTLTQAFGRYANPGTSLRYFKTSPADWWISQSGKYYNTHQHCWSGCPFTRGSPNEHLYYETPYYNYAVVINTPSGASAYPHGSAFFLHVYPSGTGPTAGCVAISQTKLVSLMRWLTPSAHPRILIGVV